MALPLYGSWVFHRPDLDHPSPGHLKPIANFGSASLTNYQ